MCWAGCSSFVVPWIGEFLSCFRYTVVAIHLASNSADLQCRGLDSSQGESGAGNCLAEIWLLQLAQVPLEQIDHAGSG